MTVTPYYVPTGELKKRLDANNGMISPSIV